MNNIKKEGRRRFRWLIICAVAIGGTLWYTGAITLFASSAHSEQERKKLYDSALAQAAASSTWPKTEQELITVFWKAIAEEDLKQAALYCPGSTESDYSSYKRLQPSPEIRIGQPQPHPRASGVTLWPAQVRFTYFGKKTIKLAIGKGPSGLLIIDGKNTIWW